MERVIITKPQERCGVYAIINLIQKQVYVGESMDLFQRLSDHIRNIMFGLEDNGTNNNLVRAAKEKGRTFEVFPVLFATNYDKSKKDNQRNHDWIVDETIYMYLFRKYGFKLYNGEDGRDNVGGERRFLINNEIKGDVLDKALEDFLDKEQLLYSIEQAEEELDNDLRKRYGKTLRELAELTDEEREKVWNDRAKSLTIGIQELMDGNVVYVIEPKMSNAKLRGICNELLKERLKKEDMERCGVHGRDVSELIAWVEGGILDRIAICDFGHYLDQSPVTILTTKNYDIEHNKMFLRDGEVRVTTSTEEEGSGVCFWAFKGLNEEETTSYLAKEDKQPKYVIMPYTTSDAYKSAEGNRELQKKAEADLNPHDGEPLEAFFERMWESYVEREAIVKEIIPQYKYYMKQKESLSVDERIKSGIEITKLTEERRTIDKFAFGYALNREKAKKYSYPEGMFPEVIAKWSKNSNRNASSVAFLISELSYVDANIKKENIFPYYKSHTDKEIEDTLSNSNSKCCAELQEARREQLLENLTAVELRKLTDKEEVNFIIAKLEYPYIIALANDPVE